MVTVIPPLMALLGIALRVMVPFWTKKAENNDLTWKWNEALPPILGGVMSFFVLLASGVLTGGTTWVAALGYGLVGTVATAGTGDIVKMAVRLFGKSEETK